MPFLPNEAGCGGLFDPREEDPAVVDGFGPRFFFGRLPAFFAVDGAARVLAWLVWSAPASAAGGTDGRGDRPAMVIIVEHESGWLQKYLSFSTNNNKTKKARTNA